jgi:hypothetical protein
MVSAHRPMVNKSREKTRLRRLFQSLLSINDNMKMLKMKESRGAARRSWHKYS